MYFVFSAAESQAKELLALTEDVSKLTAEQIEQLVSQLEKLLSGPTVSKELGDTSVNIVSNLLGASEEKLSSSSDRLYKLKLYYEKYKSLTIMKLLSLKKVR